MWKHSFYLTHFHAVCPVWFSLQVEDSCGCWSSVKTWFLVVFVLISVGLLMKESNLTKTWKRHIRRSSNLIWRRMPSIFNGSCQNPSNCVSSTHSIGRRKNEKQMWLPLHGAVCRIIIRTGWKEKSFTGSERTDRFSFKCFYLKFIC